MLILKIYIYIYSNIQYKSFYTIIKYIGFKKANIDNNKMISI